VAPAPIEDAFVSNQIVEQVMVMGDREKFISAIVIPNFEFLQEAAEREGVDIPDDPAEMVTHERVQEVVQEQVDEVNERFEKHEQIKEFRLGTDEFTEENDMLTPTMKKKRRNIKERYDDLVAEIYGEPDQRSQATADD
jgi:long-chain acyl-CoA synthetase